jgi:hypothetical protein
MAWAGDRRLRSRSRSRVIQEARPPAVEVAVGPAG